MQQVKEPVQDPNWKTFLASKQEGNIRISNMTNFISKSNVFQNDSQLQAQQKSTLNTLDMKLGKTQEEEDALRVRVDFRSEPLKPKQTNQEREMCTFNQLKQGSVMIAKPLIQEYTTLNIVRQPTIQPMTHRISADLHKNLEGLIKRSENLVLEKTKQAVVPKQGLVNQEKVINDRFLEHIRRVDQSVSPIRHNNPSPNHYTPEMRKEQSIKADVKQVSHSTLPKNKYDREFDFKQFRQVATKQTDHLEEVQLPQSITEITQLKHKQQQKGGSGGGNNLYQFQTLPDNEYLFMEDVVEQNAFQKQFREQAFEIARQAMKADMSTNNTYNQVYSTQPPQADVDLQNLDFNSILQIAAGAVPPQMLAHQSQSSLKNHLTTTFTTAVSPYQQNTASTTKTQQFSTQKKHLVPTEEDTYPKTSSDLAPIHHESEEEDEDDDNEESDLIYDDKCVGTTPRVGRDEAVQISTPDALPRVGVVLEQINRTKTQLGMAAERRERAKLRLQLNRHLIDLINLVVQNERFQGDTVGEAVQFLLNRSKKTLRQKEVDGISKLELLYIFLTEYRELKERETEHEGVLIKKKMRQGHNLHQKKLNSMSFHFRSSNSPEHRYLQPTRKPRQQQAKQPRAPASGNWITNIEDLGWVKVE